VQQVAHSLIDAPEAASVTADGHFNFALPMHVFEKGDAPEGQKRRFGGICSTDTIDRQGERILQDGLDWSDFFEHGWFNDNHSQKTADVLGYGDKTSLVQFKPGDLLPDGTLAQNNGTWVEGYLLNRPACDQIWDLAQSLQGTGRTLGFSVEGNIVKRTGLSNKTIAKAKIRNVAITACPVNPQAEMQVLARSLQAAEDLAQEEARKAMGGAGAPVPLADATGTGMTAGRIVAKEALESDLHNNAGGEILRRKGKKKKQSVRTLTRSEAIVYVQSRVPGLAREQAEEIVVRSAQLVKASDGEGSRGGHIVGHTKSGKPIYEASSETYTARSPRGAYSPTDGGTFPAQKRLLQKRLSYTAADHAEAQDVHKIQESVHRDKADKIYAKHVPGSTSAPSGTMRHSALSKLPEPVASKIYTHLHAADAAMRIGRLHGQMHRDAELARKSLSTPRAITYLQARVQGLSKADARRLLTHSKALHTAGLV
jgi:hypothetical protein